MIGIRILVLAAGCFLLSLPASAPARETQLTTTDDTRRVPIPPQDHSQAPLLVLRGGTLIRGTGDSPVRRSLVVLQGDRILYAGSSGAYEPPRTPERVIDTTGLFILPGLIDLHVHFTTPRGDDAARYHDSDAAAAIRGTLLLGQLIDA